ncbi:MAG TPA: DUF4965 domain-containing protein [Prolixibacteraceae bacterium]|nr:DUF4965 domain-containing protein [Prolixibacteraceae bacterium]
MTRNHMGQFFKTKTPLYVTLLSLFLLASCAQTKQTTPVTLTKNLRAPAYPLVTVDPYFSAWSETDNLYDDAVRHWTGKKQGLIGALRVDGQVYRFMGKEELPRTTLLPMANQGAWDCSFQFKTPTNGWEKPGYNASGWKAGKGAFGTAGMPDLVTPWETPDIWVRREFILDSTVTEAPVYLMYSHDDNFELYLNGQKLVDTGYSWKNNAILPLDGELRALLIQGGKNVIAVHCHNKTGGAYVDFGIFQDKVEAEVFAQTAVQKSVGLSATQTQYEFTCGPVDLNLSFISPLLPENPDVLSRPVNYISYKVKSTDGKNHDVQIYFEATPEWAVNQLSQEVSIEKGQTDGLTYFKAGTTEQPILEKKGDDLRIDWGYFYLCGKNTPDMSYALGDFETVKQGFAATGILESTGEQKLVTTMSTNIPVMSCASQLGEVSDKTTSGNIMIGYDDLYAIQYFGENRMAWWKKDGQVTMDDALKAASTEFDQLTETCAKFDNQLWADAVKAGGENYAELCVLAFRQSIAAHKLIKDNEGNTIFLSKENFSNGSIGTVDLTYPSAPLFLLYNPDLLKGMMTPIFYFSESGKWDKPFAAHDVGTYPLANGQTYGGDMPVEESGNMLILTTAIAVAEGNAAYAEKHWEVLTVWADYLLQNGLDPENQLCTDDFAGHFAHNTNLSIKAIMGIAGYGKLAGMLGKADIAEKYTSAAKEMATKWVGMADDGDHFRLTFDQSGTWSQKYNLVWDKILDLNIFDPEVAKKEIAFYLTKINTYGLPLDNRRTYTKSDWEIWTATLADDQATFEKFIDPIHKAFNETTSRVPMTDWYETPDATQVGFQARSVVGGYFIKMLQQKSEK